MEIISLSRANSFSSVSSIFPVNSSNFNVSKRTRIVWYRVIESWNFPAGLHSVHSRATPEQRRFARSFTPFRQKNEKLYKKLTQKGKGVKVQSAMGLSSPDGSQNRGRGGRGGRRSDSPTGSTWRRRASHRREAPGRSPM